MATLKDKFIKGLNTVGKAITPVSPVAGLAARGISSLASKPIANPVTASKVSNLTQPQSSQMSKLNSPSSATSTTPTIITPPKTQSNLPPAGQQFTQSLMNNAPTASVLGTSQTQQPETPIPTANPISTAKTSYIDAYKKYIDSMKQSADVTEAKKVYNDYIANISKSVAGKEGQGRGIPLELVRGTQEKLLKQTQPEAERLQNEITIAQGAQQATIDSLKAGVDLQGKLLEQDKPIEVDGVLYAPQEDGSYKAITSKASEGFTLGKDQVRYDAQGNVVAGGGTSAQTTNNANVDAWVKGIQSGVYKPSDVPDELQNLVAQALSSTEKPQSEISKQVVSVIDELIYDPKALAKISGIIQGGLRLGNLDPEAQLALNKYNQLKGLLSLENIKYLKGTGAISDAEQKLLANAASALGRNLLDTDFRNELAKLRNGLSVAKDNQLAPDEEEFLRSQGYTDEEIKSLTGFNSVGKTSASIPTTSRLASVNNNPGNLRFVGQAGAVKGEGGFAKFPTVEAGVKALENQIKLDASRGLTLAQFINKYAPPTENNTKKYLNDVVKMTGGTANTPIASINITSLVKAIAKKESGTQIYG